MILHMENYCLLTYICIFVVSLVGSLARMDFNSTFALMSYYFLGSYKSRVNLGNNLLVLILITTMAIAADVWSFVVQKDAPALRIFGLIIIVLEIILKVLLLGMLLAWKFRGEKTSERDLHQSNY